MITTSTSVSLLDIPRLQRPLNYTSSCPSFELLITTTMSAIYVGPIDILQTYPSSLTLLHPFARLSSLAVFSTDFSGKTN